MPFDSNDQLPKGVHDNLPEHAQDIWREAFNSAEGEYEDPENRRNPDEDEDTVAAKVAWDAVKQKYEKDSSGEWVSK